jgi:hypothetical protein
MTTFIASPFYGEKNFNITNLSTYPTEDPIFIEKVGVKNVPSTKIELNHNISGNFTASSQD